MSLYSWIDDKLSALAPGRDRLIVALQTADAAAVEEVRSTEVLGRKVVDRDGASTNAKFPGMRAARNRGVVLQLVVIFGVGGVSHLRAAAIKRSRHGDARQIKLLAS